MEAMKTEILGYYNSTLKFSKEEEKLDRFFYRPLGFALALIFNKLGFTPNGITIISIFVGLIGAICFYPNDLSTNVIGVLMFMLANTLDCADGMLARLTKRSSRVGRILDGFSGDVWFTTMYFMLGFRLIIFYDVTPWVFVVIAISGLSHGRQAAMADYFKNVHLYFLKGTKGGEIDDVEDVKREYESYSWKINPFSKVLLFFYIRYTQGQNEKSPEFVEYKRIISEKFNNEPPKKVIAEFCEENRSLLNYVHGLSFNFRSVFLFSFMLIGHFWYYFAVEIILLNAILFLLVRNYGIALRNLNKKLLSL